MDDLRRAAVEAVGGFDETLGLGADSPWWAGEETDYLLRLLADAGFTDVEHGPGITDLGVAVDYRAMERPRAGDLAAAAVTPGLRRPTR